jgi:tetratricopeptide (TPR) repeat protein
MHVLHANELAFAGRTEEARQVYMDGVNMPKSYGEAKTWFNQEAHIFYYLGCLLDSQGQTAEAQKAFEDASVYKAAVSELSMFRALALRKLLRFSEAQQVLNEMLASGTNLLVNKDLRSYYGVGSPSPMPFEYDIGKVNSVNGHILRGYALLGLGRRDEAAQEIAQAASWSPNDFRIYAFHQVKDTF